MSRVMGASLAGIDGVAVEVEVRLSSQLPRVDVVGLPEAAVRESAARVRAAIGSVGVEFPSRRVTVNLAPAGLRKGGAGLDLPIALGILAASGHVEAASLIGVGFIGELALDGRLRPVRGALAQTMALGEAGSCRVVVPEGCGAEAALAPGVRAEVAPDLGSVLAALVRERPLPAPPTRDPHLDAAGSRAVGGDLHDVRGQEHAKQALVVAAAGGHGLLLQGPPGGGKTLLARTLPGLLPELGIEEALEVTRIHSASGLVDPRQPLVLARPFRAPHHSASLAGLLGGGSPPRPGEVSLAHRGVLFLDELPEFERRARESLRQVLEEGQVVIARARGRFALPASFQLIAAANPCPCGHHGSAVRDCRCDDGALARYRSRLSGPLLDRIDLHVRVPPVSPSELDALPGGEPSAAAAERVRLARRRAAERSGGRFACNAAIPVGALDDQVRATPDARALLRQAAEGIGLSGRGIHRALRVARTVADLAGEERVGPEAMASAVELRGEDG